MPLTPQQIIANFKAAGMPAGTIAILEADFARDPNLATKVVSATSVVDRAEFGQLDKDLQGEYEALIGDIHQLATKKATMQYLSDPIAIDKVKGEINSLETKLLTHPQMDGATQAEIAKIDLAYANHIQARYEATLANGNNNPNVQDPPNPNQPNQPQGDDMNEEGLRKMQAEVFYANKAINDKQTAAVREVEAVLGRPLSLTEFNEFSAAVNADLRQQKVQPMDVATQMFKLDDVRQANQKAALDKQIETARQEGYDKAVQESGLDAPNRRGDVADGEASFVDRMKKKIDTAMEANGDADLPAHKLYHKRTGLGAREARGTRIREVMENQRQKRIDASRSQV